MSIDNAKNFARSQINASVGTGDGTISVTDASRFPSAPFNIVVFKGQEQPVDAFENNNLEVMRVTNNDDVNTLTVDRAQEGTTAITFSSGDSVWGVATADTWDRIQTEITSNAGVDDITKGVINDLVISNAELRYRDNLSQISYDGGFYDIFADESKIASSSQVFVSTLDVGDVVGNVTLAEIITDQYDINTASYSGDFLDYSDQGITSLSFFVGDSGNKAFVVSDGSNPIVYEYSLSTRYDLTTKTYTGNSFAITENTNGCVGIRFNNDGSKFYTVDNSDGIVYTYSMSTNWDITTASYNSESLNISSQEGSVRAIEFNDDGSKFYIGGNNNDTVYAYDLSTNFDITTASYNSENFSYTDDSALTGITFNGDGTVLYILGQTGYQVDSYSLSTAYDVSTAGTSTGTFDFNTEMSSTWDISFNNDGTILYALGSVDDKIFAYDVGTSSGFFSTGSFDSTTIDLSGDLSESPNSVVVSADFDIPSDSDITFEIDDGTNTVTVNDTDVDTEIDCSSLATTSLTATTTLYANTAGDETPTLRSYALYFKV